MREKNPMNNSTAGMLTQLQTKIGYSNGHTQRSPSAVFDTLVYPSALETPAFIYLLSFSLLPQITPESENDYGSYNCTASNEMGTESKEFLLIQAGQS